MAEWTDVVKNTAKGVGYIVGGAVGGLVAGVCGAAAYICIPPNSGVPVNSVFNAANFSIPKFINCVGAHKSNCAIPVETAVDLKYVSTPVVAGAAAGVGIGLAVGLGLFAYNLYQQRQRSHLGFSTLGNTDAPDNGAYDDNYQIQNNGRKGWC